MEVEESWKELKDYHTRFTKQRTDAFNFSLILLGLLLTSIVTLSIEAWKEDVLKSQWIFGAVIIVLAFFVIITAMLFCGVDYRTSCFIKEAETQLRMHEKEIKIVSSADSHEPVEGLLMPFNVDKRARDNYDSEKCRHIHAKLGTLIKWTYIGFILLGLLSFVEGLCILIL